MYGCSDAFRQAQSEYATLQSESESESERKLLWWDASSYVIRLKILDWGRSSPCNGLRRYVIWPRERGKKWLYCGPGCPDIQRCWRKVRYMFLALRSDQSFATGFPALSRAATLTKTTFPDPAPYCIPHLSWFDGKQGGSSEARALATGPEADARWRRNAGLQCEWQKKYRARVSSARTHTQRRPTCHGDGHAHVRPLSRLPRHHQSPHAASPSFHTPHSPTPRLDSTSQHHKTVHGKTAMQIYKTAFLCQAPTHTPAGRQSRTVDALQGQAQGRMTDSIAHTRMQCRDRGPWKRWE